MQIREAFRFKHATKSYLTVLGTSIIYFAMGLYFAAGNTGVYLTSYLFYRSGSNIKLDDAIWFLSVAGFSALLLPVGGWIEGKLGVRVVVLIGGILQSCGIFATYFALDTTFLIVVIVYGGSFLISLALCYTSPLVNVCKWHPNHKGLVSGIGAASMALAPTLFTPLITALVNPNNLAANDKGLFDDEDVLDRTKSSTLLQGSITLTMFVIGVIMIFPAESSDVDTVDKEERKQSSLNTELMASQTQDQRSQPITLTRYVSLAENLDHNYRLEKVEAYTNKSCEALVIDSSDPSIEPKYAFKTVEFWLLSSKVLISELIFIYLLFMYKPYGQTFIQDDYFLSTVGAACAVSNTVGRFLMGHFKDKLGYRAVSIPLSATTMLSIVMLPITSHMNKIFYGIAIVLAVGSVGSQYALMPSAAQDSFGDKYASINIGFVYMSTVIATVSSALLSQNLTSFIGWNGMIYLIASFAGMDFLSTFFMPSNPSKRLLQRYKQFYGPKQIEDIHDLKAISAA